MARWGLSKARQPVIACHDLHLFSVLPSSEVWGNPTLPSSRLPAPLCIALGPVPVPDSQGTEQATAN
ncbi:hypothetical protein PF001_g18968 [Phytophthora fragariae]|uniref:Uncharacterized protein n=1 Tax=Phytophthora fragariae TaxID=53985 RepID=A0A6A4CM96_9STRA|nr:hypothetical protein PF009_g20368 [Phytophthora fragariae]KAE8989360.1 hypothetical protein PF011_g18803 [Phytophthora fragariae]KAE9119631.1 hypothetical protein PF006_g18318 [Phytophthora fragariae]KAE9201686.1 hypothetical protein PF004_g18642 [Phytophthora fragariae]KAE9291863.1 hypothetical protein PF001_g18968 [Phytophthora fragariae]